MNKKKNNVDLLLKVADIVSAHASEPVAEWFLNGTGKFMDGMPMDSAFELKAKQGGRSPQIQYRYWIRDKYLRDAHALCVGNGITLKAIELEKRIEDFEKNLWPSSQHLIDPPETWSDVSQILFYVFKVKLPLPGRGRLYDIVSCRRG